MRPVSLMLGVTLALVAGAALAITAGIVDPQTGIAGLLVAEGAAIDLKSLDSAVRTAFEKLTQANDGLKARMLELEQKITGRAPGGAGGGDRGVHELATLLMGEDGFKAFAAKNAPMFGVQVPAHLLRRGWAYETSKAAITSSEGSDPLSQPTRSGLAMIARRRLTVRGLFTAVPVDNGVVEVPRESTFTNNAGPQGGDVSPTGRGEGELKNESTSTFSLVSQTIPTIAHFQNASRQVLQDAGMLARYLDEALLQGLAEEEEDEMLTGDGSQGTMSGINNNAAAFTGGATNQTILDTIAKGLNQLTVAHYTPTGIILHPTDWLSAQLLKNSQGDYILGSPGSMTMPRLWGVPVVPTVAQTLGKFTVIDAMKYGYIADREQANVRVSENVGENFIRNLVTFLAEERSLLVCERTTAAVYGNVSHAG